MGWLQDLYLRREPGAGPAVHPRSDEELDAVIARGLPLADPRYATGPLEGEQFWSPDSALQRPPDDIDFEALSELVQRDPSTGAAYAVPAFAEEGYPGVNYADLAVAQGRAVPGFREDIALDERDALRTAIARALAADRAMASPAPPVEPEDRSSVEVIWQALKRRFGG